MAPGSISSQASCLRRRLSPVSLLVASASLELKDWPPITLSSYALPKALLTSASLSLARRSAVRRSVRWQRGVGVVNGPLGDEVGKLYAQRYRPKQSNRRMRWSRTLSLLFTLIDALTWMATTTKAEAHAN